MVKVAWTNSSITEQDSHLHQYQLPCAPLLLAKATIPSRTDPRHITINRDAPLEQSCRICPMVLCLLGALEWGILSERTLLSTSMASNLSNSNSPSQLSIITILTRILSRMQPRQMFRTDSTSSCRASRCSKQHCQTFIPHSSRCQGNTIKLLHLSP